MGLTVSLCLNCGPFILKNLICPLAHYASEHSKIKDLILPHQSAYSLIMHALDHIKDTKEKNNYGLATQFWRAI